MPLADTQAKRRRAKGSALTRNHGRLPSRMIASMTAVMAVLLGVGFGAVGCSSASEGPVLAPLGAYETEVGASWSLALVALDSGAGGLTWTLLESPQDMHLSAANTLVWVATAFDLALGPPGQPRASGPRQTIRIRACDQDKQCVESTGSIRAVPSPR